jgi:hypothetical protein
MTTILPGLLHTMSRINQQHTAYPGTVVSSAVYEYSFAELGQLIGELYQIWEVLPISWGPAIPFAFTDYDHTNGFEEFVCTLIEHFFEQIGAYTYVRKDVERLHQGKLDRLAELFEGAQSSSDIYDRAVAIPSISNIPNN